MQVRLKNVSLVAMILGLVAIVFYWWSVRAPEFVHIGYAEDGCGADLVRQMIGESIKRDGHPVFFTHSFMAPFGASAPFMSYFIERDWLGGLVWNWNSEFPFAWVYFGVSLLFSYLFAGFVLRKMGLGPVAVWFWALMPVLLNVPRHFKTWHHFDHLPQHWLVFVLMLDAWIWQRAWRDRRWSAHLEAWRFFGIFGVLCTTGYFWGPMLLAWGVVRFALLWLWISRRRSAQPMIFDLRWKLVLPALVSAAALVVVQIPWFLGLAREAAKMGKVIQPIGWFADFDRLIEPLWLRPLLEPLYRVWSGLPRLVPLDISETVVTVGWTYLVPVVLGVFLLRKKRGGPGLGLVAPFLVILFVMVRYLVHGKPYWFRDVLQAVVPFMDFFRAASRMGLFLPILFVAIIALVWPYLISWAQKQKSVHPRGFKVCGIVAVVLVVLEFSWLLHPVNAVPAMDPSLQSLLAGVRDSRGDTVLDLPFCVAGGNGICTDQQCPNYPYSTTTQCLRIWHHKAIHGLYQSRMVSEHCQIYNRVPYVSWFNAWRENRCLTDGEFDQFCGYLEEQKSLAAVLLYPDIWKAVGQSDCRRRFDERLGAPIAEARYVIKPARGAQAEEWTRLLHYAPRCK